MPYTHACHPRGARSPRRGQSCRFPPAPLPIQRDRAANGPKNPHKSQRRSAPSSCRCGATETAPPRLHNGSPARSPARLRYPPAPLRRGGSGQRPPPPPPRSVLTASADIIFQSDKQMPPEAARLRDSSAGDKTAPDAERFPQRTVTFGGAGAALELRTPHRSGSEPAERRCGAAGTELQWERGTGGEGGGGRGGGRGGMRGPLRGVGGAGRETRGRSPGDAEGLRRCGAVRSGARLPVSPGPRGCGTHRDRSGS